MRKVKRKQINSQAGRDEGDDAEGAVDRVIGMTQKGETETKGSIRAARRTGAAGAGAPVKPIIQRLAQVKISFRLYTDGFLIVPLHAFSSARLLM